MFPGFKITIDGQDYVVPALSLGQLRSGILASLEEHDKIIAAGKTFEAMEVRGKVILAALRRNYPDFAEDKLFSFLDLNNVGNIWLTVLGASGFSSGEAKAAEAAKSDGTSAPSTGA